MGPIFILGFPRSGTTAMAQAIALLERFGTYEREGHFLYILAPALKRIMNGDYNENSMLRRPNVPETMVRSITRTVNRIYSADRDPKSTTWIDKTPDLAQIDALPVIAKLWPHARYIYLYRPPEAAVRSNLALWQSRLEGKEDKTAERWLACQRKWRLARQAFEGRYVEVFQPQMLEAPHEVAKSLQPVLSLSAAEVDILAKTWGRNKAVNRPRGQQGERYDAVSLSEEACEAVRRITASEIAHWPALSGSREEKDAHDG